MPGAAFACESGLLRVMGDWRARGTQLHRSRSGRRDRWWAWSTRRWPGSTGQAVRSVGAFASATVPGSRSSGSSANTKHGSLRESIDPEFYQPYRAGPVDVHDRRGQDRPLPARSSRRTRARQLSSIDCRDARCRRCARCPSGDGLRVARSVRDGRGSSCSRGSPCVLASDRPLRRDGYLVGQRSKELGSPHGAGREPGHRSCGRFVFDGMGLVTVGLAGRICAGVCVTRALRQIAVRRQRTDPDDVRCGRGDPRHRRAARVRGAGAAGARASIRWTAVRGD